MDDDQIDGCVNKYLKKKGFTPNDQGFRRQHTQTNTDNSLLQPLVVNHTQLESGPARYHDGYDRLSSWAYRSQDSYKHEFLRVLYPLLHGSCGKRASPGRYEIYLHTHIEIV